MLKLIQTRGRSLKLGLGGADLRHHAAGVFALGLELTDLLGQHVALVLQLFGAGLQRLALGFKRLKSIHIEKGLRAFAGLQSGDSRGQVFAKEVDV